MISFKYQLRTFFFLPLPQPGAGDRQAAADHAELLRAGGSCHQGSSKQYIISLVAKILKWDIINGKLSMGIMGMK